MTLIELRMQYKKETGNSVVGYNWYATTKRFSAFDEPADDEDKETFNYNLHYIDWLEDLFINKDIK
jgi:hypothetical protein